LPLVIHPRVRKTIGRVAAMTCVAVFASAGAAYAACPAQPTTTPFSQWGDNNSYFLVPGGSFEGTASQVGWTLNNAGLIAGNEPFHVSGASDDQSLQIDAGGTATSPTFCADSTMQDFRFFAREDSPGGELKVQGVARTWYGTFAATVAVLQDGSMSSWGPTRQLKIPRIPTGLGIPVAIRFVTSGSSSWQVDDVYVDPYRAG
jgi:hypothetical protein